MTKDLAKIRSMVDALVKLTRKNTAAHAVAAELQTMLQPPPKLADIILSLPSETHKDRAALIGLSRQAYYNLIQGQSRPNTLTVKRLADLTGVAEEQVREAGL